MNRILIKINIFMKICLIIIDMIIFVQLSSRSSLFICLMIFIIMTFELFPIKMINLFEYKVDYISAAKN